MDNNISRNSNSTIQDILAKAKSWPRLQKFMLARYEHPTWSWTRCAITAGYSKRTAKDMAGENLTKPLVKEFIAAIAKEEFAKAHLTHDEALAKLASISRTGKNMEAIAAIRQICEISGWNAPQKIEGGGTIIVNSMIPVPASLPKKFSHRSRA